MESYWRSKTVDGVTSDEDKVAPVYKLEEICELLRSSHVSIVKEVSDFILKRLDHKSPIVKQKALRLIKYSVGKSGVEFKREMQRHLAAIRQLFHYKGQLDPLKGDALNKAVRDAAHEAISAIFASDDSRSAPAEDINRRIQGFGNKNFEMRTDDKKSFLSEVVGLGTASIRQGLSSFTTAHSLRKSDNGSYKSPNLRKSLTMEIDSTDRYEKEEHYSGSRGTSDISKNMGGGTWNQDLRPSLTETSGDTGSSHMGGKSREERLLETIVTPGGVRLQPTRDAIQIFLVEASKLDAVALCHALESKLQSNLWQVRTKAACVLEAILRRKDDSHFSTIASYFNENREVVVKCSESPQSSLRDKANKVLSLLDGEKFVGEKSLEGKAPTVLAKTDAVVQMPDLIDTSYQDDYGMGDSTQKQNDPSSINLTSPNLVVDDLFGDGLITGGSSSENKKEDDPFADVSFHTMEDKEHNADLFSGLCVDDELSNTELNMPTNKNGPDLFDVISSNSEQLKQKTTIHKTGVDDLMARLSISVTAPESESFGGPFSESTFSDLSNQSSHPAQSNVLGPMQYNIPPNFMLNQSFSSDPINYSAVASLIAQQQLLANMNFQHLGTLTDQGNSGLGHAIGIGVEGEKPSPLPDVFHMTNNPITSLSATANSSKKEETKAFDFISDQLSAARNSKRVI